MSGTFPLAESRLCALFAESILYGLYIITFAYTTQVLLFTKYRLKRFDELNLPVVAGATSLFLFISINLCLNFYRSLRAFIFSSLPNGALEEYSQVSGWLNVTETSLVLIGTITGDLVLIHRCWILWIKQWRWVSVSIILWIGCLFCTIRVIMIEAAFKTEGVFNSEKIIPYGTAFWVLSIVINISTTGLTVLRIWVVEEANKRSGLQVNDSDEFPRSPLHYIICITVESGLLVVLTAIATFVMYITRSTAVYIMTAIELPTVGIAFNLIILRSNRRSKRLLLKRSQMTEEGSTPYRVNAPDTLPYTTTGSLSQGTTQVQELPYP